MEKSNPEDFYIENGKVVFTRKFLLRRGYCCKNNCRHCPYKMNKKYKFEYWEEGEYIIVSENGPIGFSMSKNNAQFLEDWLNLADSELKKLYENKKIN